MNATAAPLSAADEHLMKLLIMLIRSGPSISLFFFLSS